MPERSVHMAARPAEPLAPFVRAYQGYELSGFAPGVHLGLPSTTLTVIISLDERPTEVDDRRFDALVAGLHTKAAEVAHDGTLAGVQIDLWPSAARALFALPASELAKQTLHLSDVLGRGVGELIGRLRDAPDWPARFAVMDDALTRRLADRPRPHRLAARGGVPICSRPAVVRLAGSDP